MKLLVAMIGLLAAAGCSVSAGPRLEYFPDMVDSVPYDAYAPNPVTRDGKTLMAPAPGTIARGAKPFHYGNSASEAERAGRELINPVAAGAQALARGEQVFTTFCSPCHGPRGLGDGPVIPLFSKPPSLQAQNARSLPDGHIYHIITRGQKLMPSLAVQVEPEDRWKAILYVRSFQQGGGAR